MAGESFVHVKIGAVDEVLPVIALYAGGCFKDIYELRTRKGRCWVHKKWCSPVVPQKDDADWRGYLKAHWDNEHGYCCVDSLQGFMEVFDRAAAKYQSKKNEQGNKTNHTKEAANHVSCSRRGAAATSEGIKKGAVNTGKHVKARVPVELSLFPDFQG